MPALLLEQHGNGVKVHITQSWITVQELSVPKGAFKYMFTVVIYAADLLCLL